VRRGGTIVSGGHPTFVPLLVGATRMLGGVRHQERLILFQSEWFAAPAQIAQLGEHAIVIPTAREASRDASLTVMRRRMIAEGSASAVLAIGGRTHEDGAHTPGIEEEIRLARMQDLSVYLVGAAGGHAASVASREASSTKPWAGVGNALDAAQNEWLRQTDEYEEAARIICETVTP
jgi:hypothetical protein